MINYYPGKQCIFEIPCFIHNGGYNLITLKVYEGGGLEYWGSKTKTDFLKDMESGWLTVDVPDGVEVRVGNQGFVFSQAKTLNSDGSTSFVHKWITKESFIQDVLDSVHVGKGNRSASEICYQAYKEYLKIGSTTAKNALREAYLDVPEHNRTYILGDQDNKDFAIRNILGI